MTWIAQVVVVKSPVHATVQPRTLQWAQLLTAADDDVCHLTVRPSTDAAAAADDDDDGIVLLRARVSSACCLPVSWRARWQLS